MINQRNLRIIALLEGLSFILLLFVSMPLKYIWGMPEFVSVIGMAHGILFMAYIVLVMGYGSEVNWGFKNSVLALLAGVVPFGTFVADKRIFLRYPA
jgi:integral membrane protein